MDTRDGSGEESDGGKERGVHLLFSALGRNRAYERSEGEIGKRAGQDASHIVMSISESLRRR